MEGPTPSSPPGNIDNMIDMMDWRLARRTDDPRTFAALEYYQELSIGTTGPALSE